MPQPGLDLAVAVTVAVEAAETAGNLIRHRARAGVSSCPKGSGADVVTQLDFDAEELILGRLRAAFPGHRLVAEESGTSGGDDGRWTWLVDPLDGTNNMVAGLSSYVVGLALCRDGQPVLGVVHDPVEGRTWHALLGGGAYGPGGVRLRAAVRPHPAGPLLAWTQGHEGPRDDVAARSYALALEAAGRRVFRMWAPLLSWVMLARGDIDGMVGYCPERIDLPAGALIAAEAGLAVRGLDGDEYDLRTEWPAVNRSFVAAHPDRIDRLLRVLRDAERAHAEVKGLFASLPQEGW
jgi:myo-inositol-1(or 4)-monophosphatase